MCYLCTINNISTERGVRNELNDMYFTIEFVNSQGKPTLTRRSVKQHSQSLSLSYCCRPTVDESALVDPQKTGPDKLDKNYILLKFSYDLKDKVFPD